MALAVAACASEAPPRDTIARVSMPSQEIITGLMKSGRLALSQGRFDRAIGLFRRVRETYPDSRERGEATALLAQAYEGRGDTTLALSEYRRLVTEFPDVPQATQARMKIAELERQLAGAPSPGRLTAVYIGADQFETLRESDLTRFEQANVNLVVLEAMRGSVGAVPRTAGVLFKTDWAPVIADRLHDIVEAAHSRQMHAWAAVSLRSMDWIDPRLGWADARVDARTGDIVPAKTIDLLHPAVTEYLIGLFMDIAASGVDGVLLRADPASGPADGFTLIARRTFERDMGQPLDPLRLRLGQNDMNFAPEFWRWVGWKQREYMRTIDAVLASVRKSYPNLKVAVELHAESVTNARAGLAWFAEDLLDLRRSRFEYIVLPYAPAVVQGLKQVGESLNGKKVLLMTDSSNPAVSPNSGGIIYRPARVDR